MARVGAVTPNCFANTNSLSYSVPPETSVGEGSWIGLEQRLLCELPSGGGVLVIRGRW